MSRADYLGKQFFKIAQLTNSSICYKNTFLSPRVVAGYSQQFRRSCQVWNCLSQVATKTWAALRPSPPCLLQEQGISIRRSVGTCDRDAEGEICTEKTTWYWALNALPEPSLLYLSGCKQESVNAHPLTRGAPATAGGGNLLRFTIPYHLELTHKTPINPHLNRRTFQSPGDAVPRHCQQTAHLGPTEALWNANSPQECPTGPFYLYFCRMWTLYFAANEAIQSCAHSGVTFCSLSRLAQTFLQIFPLGS